MWVDYFKDKKELISVGLTAVSALLGVIILVKVVGFFVANARAEMVLAEAVEQRKADANDMEEYFAESRRVAGELKEKNLFAPPQPKKHPVGKVSAIIGDSVLINGKFYKVGAMIGGAKIVKIGPATVTIEWEGKEKVFSPFDVKAAPEPKKEVKKQVDKSKPEGKKTTVKAATAPEKVVEEKPAAASGEDGPLAWLGVTLSDSVKEKFLERWNQLSDEEKEQAKEQWNNLSDEQKQQAAEMWEQNL